jgi:hypothetical protein
MTRHIVPIACVLLISGCAHEKKKQREWDRALERTQQFTLYPIRQPLEYTSSILTRNIAVGTALQKNASLQSIFAQLGVARSDLEKAGVFTNPYLDAIFTIPKDKIFETELTFYLGILKVSDLWLVPIKRKIAEDELEIVSWTATTQALKTIRDTQLAYNACVQADLQLQLSANYSKTLQDILTTATHHNTSIILDYKIKTEHIKNNSRKKIALTHLQQLMGNSLRPEVHFEMKFTLPTMQKISEIKKYITSAQLAQHPIIVINQIRITRARHQLSYEQRRCIEDATIGYNYYRDFTGISGGGPFFHLSFPIGDTTHAGQGRARSLIEQYEHEADAALQLIKEEAEKLFIELASLTEQIELSNNELRPHVNHQAHSRQKMAENQPTDPNKQALLEIMNAQYEIEQSYINLVFNYYETLIHLDYTVGGGILRNIYNEGIAT